MPLYPRLRTRLNIPVSRLLRRLLLALPFIALASVGVAAAQSADGLLKVTDAFRLTATAGAPGEIRLHWKIADHYYLYRGRIKVRSANDAVRLGQLALPPGEAEHDAYLGDVVIYHHGLTATQAYTPSKPGTDTLHLDVTYQGCHEVDPKICYPPHTQEVSLRVPATPADSSHANGQSAAMGGGSSLTGNMVPGYFGKGLTNDEPLPPRQAFRLTARATGPDSVRLDWSMPKGYYLYRDRTHITLAGDTGVQLGQPRWPPGTTQHDAFIGTAVVYFQHVEVPVPIQRTGTQARRVTLQASFQGCKANSICYPMMTRTLALDLPAGGVASTTTGSSAAGISTTAGPGAGPPSAAQALAQRLAGHDRWLALLVFFLSGLVLAFTPCVLPMIPILSGLIAGAGKRVSTARALMLSLVYVVTSSLVFAIAGAIAGMIGVSIQVALQSPWVLGAFALVFVLLALSMFGFYELRLPAALQNRITSASNRQRGGSLVGVSVMGVLSALIVGSCITPPLAGGLVYIAHGHNPVFGALALFLLGLGMGAPLIVFGTATGHWLPRSGPWMKTVEAVFGVVFLALAIWMLSRFMATTWIMLMSGALLLGSGVYMGALERIRQGATGWRRLWKALGLVLVIFGAAELVGVAVGSHDLLAPLSSLRKVATSTAAAPTFRAVPSVAALQHDLAAAHAQGRPVMLDFSADWCVSCKEMEHFTYTNPAVRQAMRQFVLLQADVTANNARDKALLKHFGLFGPPATIFYDARTGRELTGLRLVGYEPAGKFLQRLRQARLD